MYFDRTASVAYRRFSETRVREEGVDLSDCIGKLRGLDGCMRLDINLKRIKQELGNLDFSDSDCSARLA